MSASEIERTLVRLAHEIVEKHDGSKNVGLVGIKRRGVPLAQRLAKLIETDREASGGYRACWTSAFTAMICRRMGRGRR